MLPYRERQRHFFKLITQHCPRSLTVTIFGSQLLVLKSFEVDYTTIHHMTLIESRRSVVLMVFQMIWGFLNILIYQAYTIILSECLSLFVFACGSDYDKE